jgi:hypothetical protein
MFFARPSVRRSLKLVSHWVSSIPVDLLVVDTFLPEHVHWWHLMDEVGVGNLHCGHFQTSDLWRSVRTTCRTWTVGFRVRGS